MGFGIWDRSRESWELEVWSLGQTIKHDDGQLDGRWTMDGGGGVPFWLSNRPL